MESIDFLLWLVVMRSVGRLVDIGIISNAQIFFKAVRSFGQGRKGGGKGTGRSSMSYRL